DSSLPKQQSPVMKNTKTCRNLFNIQLFHIIDNNDTKVWAQRQETSFEERLPGILACARWDKTGRQRPPHSAEPVLALGVKYQACPAFTATDAA
ncbi:MAG: hypothetical protein WCJ02_17720, partial [bacterium]